jgi:hypothetical protein
MSNSSILKLILTEDSEAFDIREDMKATSELVASVVDPLLKALGELYNPATLAVIMDIAAKTQSYAAVEAAALEGSGKIGLLAELSGVMEIMREGLREAGEIVHGNNAPLAEALWG